MYEIKVFINGRLRDTLSTDSDRHFAIQQSLLYAQYRDILGAEIQTTYPDRPLTRETSPNA